MGVLGTCTVRMLKRNPVRTTVTVVGIALATALILAVATSAVSLASYVVNLETEQNGSYNAAVLGADASEVAGLAQDADVARYAVVRREGFALVNEANNITPYLDVCGLVPDSSADLADLVSLRLSAGRMPRTPDEIVLPASLMDAGVLDAGVGSELTLPLGERVGTGGESLALVDETVTDEQGFLAESLVDTRERSFTVVGLYADNLALSRSTTADGGTVAGLFAFTVAPSLESAGEDALYQVWLGVADPAAAEKTASSAFGDDAAIGLNRYVNMITSFSLGLGVYRTLARFAVLVLAVVVASSVMLIRNSFAISVSERTRQFGLLSSVGATRRQLRGMVLREALILAAVGIPAGLALGFAGTAGVLWACRDLVSGWALGMVGGSDYGVVLTVVFSPVIVAGAVVLALLTIVLSAWGPARRASRLSAIDAIRSAADVRVPAGVRRRGRICAAVFGIEGGIAAKSFCRAAKSRRATVASLVTGAVLVVTAMLLGTYVNAFFTVAAPGASRTYDLRYFFYEGSVSGVEGAKATPEEALRLLAGSQGVTDAASALQVLGTSSVEDGDIDRAAVTDAFVEQRGAASNVALLFVEDGAYRAWLEERGLPVDELMDVARPRAVALNAVAGTDDGRYAMYAPFTGETFTLRCAVEVDPASPLNDAGAEGSGADAPDGFNGFVSGRHALEVEVGAFADEGPWWLGTPSTPVVLLPLSAATAVDGGLLEGDLAHDYLNRFWELYVRSDDPAATEASMRAHLQALGLSDTRLHNQSASSLTAVSLYRTAQMFLWAFAVIVTLIAVTGAFNTMHTGIGLRRREFAVLRSVGMTRRGLVKMLFCECLVYAVHVLLWAVPISCLVSLGLQGALGASVAGVGFAVPWAVLPAVPGAFVVVGLACATALRKVDVGASPVEALRSEVA